MTQPVAVPPLEAAPAWQALRQQAQRFAERQPEGAAATDVAPFDLRTAFAADVGRVTRFSQTLADAQGELLHVDFSKAHIDAEVMQHLLALADQRQVLAQRDAMLAGAVVNTSEQRQAMHWLLRAPQPQSVPAALRAAWCEMDAERTTFLDFAERIRADARITDVVNIGIGGSDLGPCMAVQALAAGRAAGKRFHFVSNIDRDEIDAVLRQVQPAHTLFIIASKTFTTLETMTNARTALQWFAARGGQDVGAHFVGITTDRQASAAALGVRHVFGVWDWVGGRYSVWSAVGLALAIASGADGFCQFLAGAHAVDRHFATTPAASNLPLLLGLLDVWYASFLGYPTRCIAPYSARLQRLPAYLQQLEMESNGKCVNRQGQPVRLPTAPVVWGEPGTNGQHAFFQMLHQGAGIVPTEFVAVRQPVHALEPHNTLLLANALAQAQALMQGRHDADPQRHCPGNRPSIFTLLPDLSPRTLGALLALHEHRVFVGGAVWGINSFDQFGVELGKQLAQDIALRFASGNVQGLDASTADLLQRLR